MAAGDLDRGEGVTGGIAAVRDAFNQAAQGKFVATQIFMTYDHSGEANAQILEIVGHQAGGASQFRRKSAPIPPGHSLIPAARALAAKLIAEQSNA